MYQQCAKDEFGFVTFTTQRKGDFRIKQETVSYARSLTWLSYMMKNKYQTYKYKNENYNKAPTKLSE